MPAEIHIQQPEFHHPAELAMLARLREHGPALVEEYLAMYRNGGVTFIARDAATKLFPEYNADPTVNNRYSDQAASALAEAVRLPLLSEPPLLPRNGRSLLLTLMNNSGAVTDVIIHHDVERLIEEIGSYNTESCLRVMNDELSQIDQEDPIPPEILREAKLCHDLG